VGKRRNSAGSLALLDQKDVINESKREDATHYSRQPLYLWLSIFAAVIGMSERAFNL
jgi:hypothetical protein